MSNNKQQTEINAVEYLDKVNQFAKENNTDKPRQQTAIEWFSQQVLDNWNDIDAGARDIIAELINENDVVRAKMRLLFEQTACIQTKVLSDKETEGIKYKDYFDFSEPIHKIPSHRTMAILRGFL